MNLRFFAIGAATVLLAVAASSSVVPARRNPLFSAATPGRAHLYAFGTRSAQQRKSGSADKMDGMLADLTRHVGLVRPKYQLQDLRALSPAARFAQTAASSPPLVLIDAVTRGDPRQLESALESLGLERASVYKNDVGGWLPVTALAAATARGEVSSIRAAMPHKRGAVALQGDFAQKSSVVRSLYPSVTGANIKVGVLSDSFDCYSVYAAPGSGVPASGNEGYAYNGFTADYATDVSTGALPAGVDVLEEADCMSYNSGASSPTFPPFSDEGRAMLQIVHVVAPGASLAFYTAENSEADFANGIQALATAGAKVIADDIGYFDEPFFQDGLEAQAINAVEANGVAYFSAAGNDSDLSYENTAPSFATTATSGSMQGELLLNFDTTGATNATSLPVTIPPIPPGDFIAIVVEWDQPYVTGATGSPGASSSIDLCVTGASAGTLVFDNDGEVVSCTGLNAVGVDPVQIMTIGNPTSASANTAQQTLNIMVGLGANSKGTIVPGRIIVSVEDDGLGSSIASSLATNSATIQGHPGAAGAAAVGAAFYFQTPQCGTSPAVLETFSSVGGEPILFDTTGTRLATPVVRQKPDFVGPDGVNDTFLGFTLASQSQYPKSGLLTTSISQCQNNPDYPNFFGTSAATPHAAGIAALMLQASPGATPTQIYNSLRTSALPMSTTTPNFDSGYGFIQADAAFAVPTLTLAASTIAFGGSTTLSWSTIDASSCVASGGWTGSQATSGSVTVTPTVAGPTAYTLTCSNTAGTSAAGSAVLFATSGAPPAAPSLSLSATSIRAGQSATISWSDTATNCTASGSWTGTLSASGDRTITPTAVGTETFTLICTNNGGPSAASSVTLTVTPEVAVPPAPVLTLGETSVPADSSLSITWSSPTATSCIASGSTNATSSGWTGTLAASGTNSLTPVTEGSYTYSLACSNSAGTSPTATATLTVTAPKTIGSGGGALDVASLMGLAALLLLQIRPRKSA
jgi:subtilase family protein